MWRDALMRRFLRLFRDYRALESQLRDFGAASVANELRARIKAEEWKALYLREKSALEAALAQMAKD